MKQTRKGAKEKGKVDEPSLFDDGNGSNAEVPFCEAGRKPSPFSLTPDQQRALDLTTNRVISASAGTGKTHTLTALYLALLSGRLTPGESFLDEESWLDLALDAERAAALPRPRQIVAVTFTEKAAAELLERARVALAQLAESLATGKLKDHLELCDREMFTAPVSTIHAFCARLLREAGADSPAPAGFSVLEEEEANQLLETAFARTAAEALAGENAKYLNALALEWNVFGDHFGLLHFGQKLLKKMRSLGLEKITVGEPGELAVIIFKFQKIYAAVLSGPTTGRRRPSPKLSEFCSRGLLPKSVEDAIPLALELESVMTGVWILEHELCDTAAEILLLANRAHAAAFADFVSRAGAAYQSAKRAVNALDFDDLLLGAKELLDRDNGALAGSLSEISFLLIDEYQDTNPLQDAILTRIAMPTADAGVRLAVVGDVKQSIYRFRGADVALLENLALKYSARPLRENFRSRAKVVDFINGFFEFLWRDKFIYDQTHRIAPAGAPERHAWNGPAAEVFVWPPETVGNADEHRQQQAVTLARRIRTLVGATGNLPGTEALPKPQIWDTHQKVLRSTVKYGDIAILARTLKGLRVPLQMALAQLRVPFRLLKGANFFTRPEIIDVLNLWTVAADFNASYAAAGLLRSPFVGLSDAGLWWLARQNEKHSGVSLAQAVLQCATRTSFDGLCEDDIRAVQRAVELFKMLAATQGRRTAAEILEWAAVASGFFNTIALQPRGEHSVAAVRKLIELARAHEARGNTLLGDFVRWLNEQADAEWDQDNEKKPDLNAELPADSNEIQIGTIHSAKGLEFPIVILADLAKSENSRSDPVLLSEKHGLGLRLGSLELGLGGASDLAHREAADADSQAEREESLRLLYVALTRARDYLILCGDKKRKAPKKAHVEDPDCDSRELKGSWRDLLDGYIANNPSTVMFVQSDNPNLRAVRADSDPGLLKFDGLTVAGVVNEVPENPIPKQLAALLNADPAANTLATSAPREIGISVSKLAAWLWCPRKLALDAMLNSEPIANDTSTAEISSENGFDPPPTMRDFGTAAHAAFEAIFSSENSTDVSELARRTFHANLPLSAASDERTLEILECILTVANSEWGRRVASLKSDARITERPFRSVIQDEKSGNTLILKGTFDLLAETEPRRWQLVDFKLAQQAHSSPESAARYAWQVALYACIATELLQAAQVSPALLYVLDPETRPVAIEQAVDRTMLEATLRSYAETSSVSDPLSLPAQTWQPGVPQAHSRSRVICESHHCPHLSHCFAH